VYRRLVLGLPGHVRQSPPELCGHPVVVGATQVVRVEERHVHVADQIGREAGSVAFIPDQVSKDAGACPGIGDGLVTYRFENAHHPRAGPDQVGEDSFHGSLRPTETTILYSPSVPPISVVRPLRGSEGIGSVALQAIGELFPAAAQSGVGVAFELDGDGLQLRSSKDPGLVVKMACEVRLATVDQERGSNGSRRVAHRPAAMTASYEPRARPRAHRRIRRHGSVDSPKLRGRFAGALQPRVEQRRSWKACTPLVPQS